MKYCKQAGMTLLEITVVLLILLALAGLAMPYIGGTSSKALCDATDVSMANIKRAIMDRYYLDTLGKFPADKGSSEFSLDYLFNQGNWQTYDIDTQTGWRGPYLQQGIVLDSAATTYKAANLPPSFTTDTTYVNKILADSQTVVLDAWGRPIIIQVVDKSNCSSQWGITTDESDCARLVSAGPGRGLDISEADLETPINGNRPTDIYSDDRILYLNVPTPASDNNLPCGD